VKRDATQPPYLQIEADRRSRPLPDREGRGAVAPSGDERHDAEAVDPTAVIDWLVKRPRTRSD
jgi:hypothetical protein